jgi:ribosomal protein S18 acetylase RimI-like enzyme
MSTAIAIRKAQPQDAAAIAECLASAFAPFRSQYTAGAFADTVLNAEGVLDRMTRMTVCAAITPEGEIVGTVATEVMDRVGHLRGMAVRPEWQGHAIAGQLLRGAENDMRSAGCHRITLDTTAPLERAIRFYEGNGYAPSGKVSDFFGMPLHEFVKQLEPTASRLTAQGVSERRKRSPTRAARALAPVRPVPYRVSRYRGAP